MNTWSFKLTIVTAALLALAACDDAGRLSLLDGSAADRSQPGLVSASLAGGDVTLVAPDGMCIDPGSVTRTFALMARCDTLGARDPRKANAPLAILTASVAPERIDGPIDHAALNDGVGTIIEEYEPELVHLVRLQADAPSSDLSQDIWRGAGSIGGHVMAVTLYNPDEGETPGSVARELITQTLDRSLSQSINRAVASAGQKPVDGQQTGANNTRFSLSGLFGPRAGSE